MLTKRWLILVVTFLLGTTTNSLSAWGKTVESWRTESSPQIAQAIQIPRPKWLNEWLSGPLPGQPLKSNINIFSGDPRNTIQTPRYQSSGTYIPTPLPPLSDTPRQLSILEGMEERYPASPSMYLSVGIVASTGQTDWNHDATSSSSLLGNPTSELTYDNTHALALEVKGQIPFSNGFFVRGNFGTGISTIGEGNLRDDDFLANQVILSSTNSVIPDTDLFYATFDIGQEVANFDNRRGSLSLFVGFQYWREEYKSFGLFNRLTKTQTLSENTPAINNTVEWKSLRLGAIGSYRQNDRVVWTFDIAAIPYTDMHNEDSHLLRTSTSDLGPTPNVIMDGSGYGIEGEIGFTYAFAHNLTAAFDIRYWKLMSDGEITLGPQSNSPSTFPLNDLDTYRFGVNAGIRYTF